MMRQKLSRILCCTALCCTPLLAWAQAPGQQESPLQLLDEGTRRFEGRAFGAACAPLQQYLRQTSRDSSPAVANGREEAAYMLACAAYELDQADCMERFEAFLASCPATPHAHRIEALMASVCFRRGDYAGALQHFDRADLSQLAPGERDDMTYRMALSRLHTGDLKEAAIWLEALRATSRRYRTDCTYHLGYIRYAQQRYDEALAAFGEVRNTEKYAPLAPYYIAEIHLIRRQYDDAASLAAAYIKGSHAQPHRAEMYRILGAVRYHKADYNEARKQLEAYVQECDDAATLRRDALYMLGLSQYQCAVYTRVSATLGKVVAQGGNDARHYDALTQNAYLHMGLAYLQLGEKPKARMAFEQAAAVSADPAVKERAAYNYALCIHETAFSAFGESVRVFEKFLNDYPSSVYTDRVSSYLVEVYMNTRSYDAALQSINRISRPTAALLEAKQKILFQLGTQSFANTLFPQAIDYFSQSIELGRYNPKTRAEATYWMAEANYRIGRQKVTQDQFEHFLTLASGSHTPMYALAYYNLGYIAFNRHDYALAEQRFNTCIGLKRSVSADVLADALNRLGDCAMQGRRFAEATAYYTRAHEQGTASGDYSLYQLAQVAGLQKEYDRKVSLLDRLSVRYPRSPYVASALYEKGRSFVQTGDAAGAIRSYQALVAQFPESPASRKAAAEIGLLYYQSNQADRAIAAYRDVITRYPGSDEARLALRDLKSIYVDADRVSEFAALAAQMPGAIRLEAGEQDSLTYVAAERIYQKGDHAAAAASLDRYLQSYPDGVFSLNAHYYLALIARERNDEPTLLAHTGKLIEYTGNPYTEEALLMQGEVMYNRRDYAEAMKCYTRLQATASTAERQQLGMVGVMRCATLLPGEEVAAIAAATTLLAQPKLTPELRAEALYHRGKAYLNLRETDKARTDLAVPAADTRTLYGAEAKYLLAAACFNATDYARAEQELLDFIDRSTPHAYWLARGFILLSDVYVAMDRRLDARQYLLSLQQNYDADPAMAQEIATRLEKLDKELKNEK